MNSLVGALERAQRALTASGIQSAAIGALALSIWGRARATSDVDLKVLVARDRAADLLAALPGYTPLVEEPLQVIQRLGFVFLRDPQGVRIDLLLADAGFDEGAVRRAREVEVLPGHRAVVCTAEDLVIYKLISTRPRDHEDAESVVLRQGAALDVAYVETWLRELEMALDDSTLVEAFQRMRRLAL